MIIFPKRSKIYKYKPTDIVTSFVSTKRERLPSRIQDEIDKLYLNKSVYNGKKYRLEKITLGPDNKIYIVVEETDYFTYLVTNNNIKNFQFLFNLGKKKFNNGNYFISNAIGNLILITTSDNKIPILIRSNQVSTFKGKLDLPGGHPEPTEETKQLRTTNGQIFFDGILNELTEELHISSFEIKGLSLIGMVKNLEDGLKPEMIFYANCKLSSFQIKRRFQEVGTSEATDLCFFTIDSWKSFKNHMTYPTKIALEILGYMKSNR